MGDYCGLPAMLEEPLRFSLSRCLDGWMYGCMEIARQPKGKPLLECNDRLS